MLLNAKKVASLKEPGRYRDGRNLFLQITPGGVKSWVFRYQLAGKERMLGLGPLHADEGPSFTVPLASARDLAEQARKQLAAGIDPVEAKKAKKDADRKERIEQVTFKEATEEFLKLHENGWRNEKHRQQWRSTLETYAYPKLGARPVPAIDPAVINDALAPIWQEIPETAARTRHRIERVLKWVREGKPLPAPTLARRTKNHPALPYAELPEFMAELRARDSISARALEFLILTAARTGEVIGATWDEFDLKQKLWTVPGERMKSGREHRVPLSDRAIEILTSGYTDGGDFVFIGGSKGKGLSNMALLELMRGMRPGYVPHGFRSTFKDWASETTSHPNMVSEAALAHVVGDKTEAAYRRGDLFAKRTRLMRDWAAFCATPRKANGANVVKLRA